jgi:dynactin 5
MASDATASSPPDGGTLGQPSPPEEINDDNGYIQTTTHNYVSRRATIDGSQQVELKGRSVVSDNVHIRGDLAVIRMGRYCFLSANTRIQPPPMPGQSDPASSDASSSSTTPMKYVPVSIGSHTVIGKDCTIQAAAVGSSCWIENGVTLGPRCIVKDCCVIAQGTVIPADTVLPPFTRASMSPASSAGLRLVTQVLPPAMAVELQERAIEAFQDFVLDLKEREKRPKT